MSDAFDGRGPSWNNSGAIHRSVPTQVGVVMVMLSEWLRTLVSPKSAMRAEKLLSIEMLLYRPLAGTERRKNSTYAFQICMNGRPVMEILQSTSDVCQLRERGQVGGSFGFGGTLTSFSRLVSGNAVTKSMIIPCSIHSETIIRVCEVLVAPSSGNRFECPNCFHSTTSWQNLCLTFISTSASLKRDTQRAALFPHWGGLGCGKSA